MFTVPAQMIKEKFILSLLGLTTLQIVILVPKFRMGKIWQNYAILLNFREKAQIGCHQKLPKNYQIPLYFWR